MKRWQETSRILDRATRLAEAGRQAAVATVTHIEGSAYRRPGAKLLVADDGDMIGSVSGGCLEQDIREVARAVVHSGVPRLLHYETGADDQTVWGLGLGCNGSVDIFVQPATSMSALEVASHVKELLRGEAGFAVSTILEGAPGVGRTMVVGENGVLAGSTGDAVLDRTLADRTREVLAAGESRVHEVAASHVFTEVMSPPPHLLICGAGDDARPLAAYALDAGFRVAVLDHRPAYLVPDRFPAGTQLVPARSEEGFGALQLGPYTYAVVKTHSLARDRQWVGHLVAGRAAYIGLLGPRSRTDDILQECGVSGDERVFGPVGLDLGAEGAEQVAISIVAELLAVWSGREPSHLRERKSAIHA